MTALIRPARVGFVVVSWLLVAGVVVQAYMAGLGVFEGYENFLTHRDFGYLLGLFPMVMLVLSLLGRMQRLLVGASVLLIIQFVLQSVFVAMRDQPAVAALHAVDGFLILVVAIVVAWSSRGYLRLSPTETG
jgi:tellurite resistance protein TehA-like permease